MVSSYWGRAIFEQYWCNFFLHQSTEPTLIPQTCTTAQSCSTCATATYTLEILPIYLSLKDPVSIDKDNADLHAAELM